LRTAPALMRQRGALNLSAVVIGAMLLAAAAMAALISMRSERNLFAEGAAMVGKAAGDSARAAGAGSGGTMRKCVINGKTVVSNTDCSDQNKTSKTLELRDSRGFEAPKLPPVPPEQPRSDKIMEKMIEKQLQ
jgi:hypothetical protein